MKTKRIPDSIYLAMLVVVPVLAFAGIRSQTVSDDMQPSSKVEQQEPAAETSNAAGTETTSTSDEIPAEAQQPAKPGHATNVPEHATRADAFIAGPDWEFDGFVAGGQDSKVRSMFYLNDLLYLNIGAHQGIAVGDRLEIYKRGDKVRDPQNGRFIGYEVRRAAVVRATERLEDEACAVRIVSTQEPVEIGDLVRRIQ